MSSEFGFPWWGILRSSGSGRRKSKHKEGDVVLLLPPFSSEAVELLQMKVHQCSLFTVLCHAVRKRGPSCVAYLHLAPEIMRPLVASQLVACETPTVL